MDGQLQYIYLTQIRDECERCIYAVHQMNDINLRGKPGNFFYAVFDLVHHSAAVSRYLWPPSGSGKKGMRATARGKFLRDLLGLAEGHPIEDRALRNHFEHIDERLDDWAETSICRNMVRYHVGTGPGGGIGGNAITSSDMFHHWDPEHQTLGFRGEHFDIQKIVHGICEIYDKTVAMVGQSHRPIIRG
jgi:hypothetical protein